MKFGSRRTTLAAMGTMLVCLLGVAFARGQAGQGPEQRPPMSEEVFKNVQVLKGIPVGQFMATMGFFSASLGMSCEDCHSADDRNWGGFAVDSARKRMARRMITMMQAINKDNFGGRQMVTCYSCHRGGDRPRVTPDLAQLYGVPPPPDANAIIAQAPGAPSADQVLDRYIQAVGGAQRVASLTSFVATGTSVGYGPESEKRPVEIFAKAPGQRTTIIHTSNGDSTATYDGRAGWIAAPLRPVAVLQLTGQELDGAKLDAELSFPARIKQAVSRWRVGFPSTIDDREVDVVQGTTAGGTVATFYFDKESGLLSRMVRYSDSPVGKIPTQIDYADYRDVSGVRMPYRFTMTWLDGRDTVELSQMRPNAPIDAAKFAKPVPSVPPPPRSATPSSSAASSAAGQLRQIAYVKASTPHANDHFGNGGTLLGDSVAISGDGNTMAIGAPNESSAAKGINGNQNDTSVYSSGAVYVFTRRGSAWTQQAYVKPSNPGMSDEFGHVVGLSADGNTMAVSAYFEASNASGVNGNQADDSIPQAGAVYVFVRQGNTWSQQAYIKASNTGRAGTPDEFGDGDQFGFSLALSDDGNTIAVGANTEDSAAAGINGNQADDSKQSAGAVYVFTRAGSTWSQQAYVKAANSNPGDQFGYAVSLSADGNTLGVGSFDEDGSSRQINGPYDTMRNGSGAVYVFTRNGAAWTQQAYLKASNAEAGDSLGVSVAISDDGHTLVAGSLDEDCMATGVNPPQPCDNERAINSSTGAVYVFVRTGTAWTQQAYVKASNTGKEDWFGSRLTLSGDGNTLAAAAQLEDSGAQGINGKQDDEAAQEAGAVYFFTRTGATWAQRFYVKGSNTEAFDEFGSSVALSRDGRTMAVGARAERSAAKGVNGNQGDNSAAEAGAGYVFAYNAEGQADR